MKKKIKLLDGTIKTIKIDKIKNTKKYYILEKAGMPIRKNKKIIDYGDMKIKFNILFNLSEEQRNKISEILTLY